VAEDDDVLGSLQERQRSRRLGREQEAELFREVEQFGVVAPFE